MHLIPESAESIETCLKTLSGISNSTIVTHGGHDDDDEKQAWYVGFPWSNLLAGAGILLFYSMDSIVNEWKRVCMKYKTTMKRFAFCATLLSEGVTWFSLSLHSAILGFAFGAEDNQEKVWILFAAIMAHHFFESVAFGFLLQKKFANHLLVLVFFGITFAASIPIGIGIGMALSAISSPAFQLLVGLSLSFASGALIYVALFEILQEHEHVHLEDEEFQPPQDDKTAQETSSLLQNSTKKVAFLTPLRCIAFAIGYAFMASLAAFE